MKKEEIQAIEDSMVQYTATKTVYATPMTRGEYFKIRGWELQENESPDDSGYLVQSMNYGIANVKGFNGYISWHPHNAFEAIYKLSGSDKDKMYIQIEQLFTDLEKVTHELSASDNDIETTRLLSAQMHIIQAYHQILAMRYEKLGK